MRDFIASNVKSLKPSLLNAFFDEVSRKKGITSLSVGEPDFNTPWHIADKALEAIEDGKTFYTSSAGLENLRRAISRRVKRKYQRNYDDDEILITVGASEAIDLALRTILNPGDEVILTDPGYVSYEPLVTLLGGKPVLLPLHQENGFRPDPKRLKALITEKTKAVILNYPNNPTGAVLDKDTAREIAKTVLTNDILLISDEIYSELTYGKESASFLDFPDLKDHLLYINGLSKSYAMTGWRIGYILTPKYLMDKVKTIHQYSTLCPPTISQIAGVEAILHGDRDTSEMKKSYRKRRDYVIKRLRNMGLEVHVPEGAFYVFPKIPEEPGLDSLGFCKKLLRDEKLAIIPGNAFGEGGEGHVRISYAYALDDLKVGLDKLEHFLKKLRKR